MANGDVLLDPDGNVLLDSDGDVLLDDGSGSPCRCCGGGYRQARRCSDDGLVDVWMTTDDADTLTGAFKISPEGSGSCFYFNFADGTSDTPGTIYAAADVTETDIDCGHCCICCTELTVTISAPNPASWRGVYDVHRVAGCDSLTGLAWETDAHLSDFTPGALGLFWTGGTWKIRLIDSDGIEEDTGSSLTADGDVCPEYANITYGGITIECADGAGAIPDSSDWFDWWMI